MALVYQTSRSQFEFGNRIDAELYNPQLRESYRKIIQAACDVKPLRSLCVIRSGTTPSDRSDGLVTGPVLFKTSDIRNSIVSPYGVYYHIAEPIHRRMSRTRIHPHDVLLNIVGATLEVIGRSGFVGRLAGEANITQAMVLLRVKDPSLKPGFLFAFLNTKFGQDQIKRFARPTGQYNLNLHEVGRLCVPLPSEEQQTDVHDLVIACSTRLESAAVSHLAAQQLLESGLQLDRLTLRKPTGNTGRFSAISLSDTFNAGRFDAQCFCPDALFYEDRIHKYTQCDRLASLLQHTAKGRQQAENQEGLIDYCSIKHISEREIAGASRCCPTKDTPLASPGDLLLAITGATIGKIGIVRRYKTLAYSGDLIRLRAKPEIDPHYLLLVLAHPLGQFQFRRWITGSTNGHLAPRDIRRVLVPRLENNTEDRIAELVEECLTKRVESEQLLHRAIMRVERLVEAAAQR